MTLEGEGNESVERELSYKEMVQILTWSFYYSQGSDPIQSEIYAYIARKHPEWKIAEPAREEALASVVPFATDFVQKGPHTRLSAQGKELSAADLASQSRASMEALEDAVNRKIIHRGDDEISVASLTNEQLLERLIHLDANRLLHQGRPNRGGIAHGPHRSELSQFVSYVLKREKAPGHPVYTEMFEDLAAAYERWRNDGTVRPEVAEEARRLVAYIKETKDE